MSAVFPDVQLDVDLLIQEVKKRPCLYEKNHLRYGDPQYKRVEWDEVTAALFKDVWDSYNNEEKVAKCDQVLKRWKNLRACFTRECKRQKDPKWIYGVSYKRRKYIYYNELSFLKSDYDTQETTIDIDLPENSETENTTLTVNDKFGEPIPDSISIPKTNAKVKRIESPSNFGNTRPTNSVNAKSTTNSVKPTASTNSASDKSSTNSDPSYSSPNLVITNITSNSDNSSMNSVTKPSSNSVLINVNDTDSTSFALSLVPMLNMLSMNDKVECQIKILSAILPFMKKFRDDSRTGDDRKRKTATPTRQTYGKKRMEDIISVEIKSEEESDGDLYV